MSTPAAQALRQPVKTADLMLVAMMEFGFDDFVTSDKQQHDFAMRAGMRSIAAVTQGWTAALHLQAAAGAHAGFKGRSPNEAPIPVLLTFTRNGPAPTDFR